MDLRDRGIQITLERGMTLVPHLTKFNVNVGYYSKNRGMFELASGRYSVDNFLGMGQYSTIIQGIHESNNTVSTFKIINMAENTIQNVLSECIIHILLEKESEGEPLGPYVPRFLEAAYDPIHNLMLLRTERIQDILYYRYKAGTPEENDIIIPYTIAQISYILKFFYDRLKFSHRDCKADNILYNYSPETGVFDIRIIDFTFSCLTWQGIQIKAGEWFSRKEICYHPTRDMTQYLYFLAAPSTIQLSPKLRRVFHKLLQFQTGDQDRLCDLLEGCDAYGIRGRSWGDLYTFLNEQKIVNPNTEPLRLMKTMLDLLRIRIRDTENPLVVLAKRGIRNLKHCTPEKVLNPRTSQCVKRNSAIGRELLKKSKKYSTPTTRTLKRQRVLARPKITAKRTRRCRSAA